MIYFRFSGGIYGKAYRLQIVTPAGDTVTLTGNAAFSTHTRIMLKPKGEERTEEVWTIFQELKPHAENTQEA